MSHGSRYSSRFSKARRRTVKLKHWNAMPSGVGTASSVRREVGEVESSFTSAAREPLFLRNQRLWWEILCGFVDCPLVQATASLGLEQSRAPRLTCKPLQ